MTISIEVVEADWGGADPENIRAVCLSVAECFGPAIAEKPLEPIRVEPSALIHPRAVFERTESGHVQILLSVKGTYWANLAYQFAHEFCHVLANIPTSRPPVAGSSDWIEESLCEAGSLFALRKMASTWRTTPPYRNWADYAPALGEYAEAFLTTPKYEVPVGETFTEWLARSVPLLERDCYRRDDNAVVARHLLPIFESDVEAWRAVRYLKLWGASEDVPSANYFSTWRSVTPSRHHSIVNRIEHCLAWA